MSSEIKEFKVEVYDTTKKVMYHIKEILLSTEIINVIAFTDSSPIATRAAESLVRFGYVTYENIQTVTNVNNNRRSIKLIITLKKTANFNKLYEENEKERKKKQEEKEKDIYELEVINQVLYNEEDSEGKNKKSGKETTTAKSGKESENEWGEIEQNIFEGNKDINNDNLLNSLCIEIEKENGNRQLKFVEISKDDNCLNDDPCLKIKYTVEDKICLNSNTPSKKNKLIKEKKSYISNNKYTGIINPSLRRENASEVYLKESKSNQNLFSSSDGTDKIFFSGSTVPSTQKYSKYSNALNNLNNKEKIDEIKNLNYRFNEELNEDKNKTYELTPKIIEKEKENEKNLIPNKITNLKYNKNSYDVNANKKRKN